MIPGMLIQVKPYKYMTAYYKLLTPAEYSIELQTGGIKQNTLALEPGMICLTIGQEKYDKDAYCKILVGDRVCYIHNSLYHSTNFDIIKLEEP